MHDIKYIRDHPDAFDAALKRCGEPPVAGKIIQLDKKLREEIVALEANQASSNTISQSIASTMSQGGDASDLKAKGSSLKKKTQTGQDQVRDSRKALNDFLLEIRNLPHDSVPDGEEEADNPVLREVGEKPSFDFEAKEHFDLGEALGLMDFETAARMSGARFTILKGGLARLERALGQFMINLALEAGYEEVSTPSLVLGKALYGTGQLPKFADDLFQTEDGLWMIPTSEVTLSNLHRETILAEEDLPIRYAALTPCYRAEAGSAGKDTRGMIRQHQFAKVELVTIATPENSLKELERKTKAAEEVLKLLKLPYRVVELCTGDLGFSARKTYDIEVWLPGQGRYREISSCSDCGDFQARRMNMRCRKKDQKQTRFPHTLNGSALAVGRCLVAVIENCQQADGSIAVPSALSPYMGGLKKIGKA
ncbi:MAG: serine--tRNA ligase [Proteobacteria bacterium]|nr:serine--tRNA ligase [Pseudomonadota bacterium]